MLYTSESIERMIEILSSLPSIGRKSAQRLTYYLVKQPDDFIAKFAKGLIELKEKVKYCSQCFNYTEVDPCPICSSERRDRRTICVVEAPNDVIAIEKTSEYKGLYHVLHGVINPLEGITQNDIKIKELMERINSVEEVIVALNPSIEGEVTTQYIAKLLTPLGIKTTRIARGMPVGAELEFVDDATITRAIEGRVEVI
jgi:recombination protein RecR